MTISRYPLCYLDDNPNYVNSLVDTYRLQGYNRETTQEATTMQDTPQAQQIRAIRARLAAQTNTDTNIFAGNLSTVELPNFQVQN